MPSDGSPMFASYTRNLRRIYWVEFIDAQTEAARPSRFRASLVNAPLRDQAELAATFEYHRHRTDVAEE